MNTDIKKGDSVLVSPDLTGSPDWIQGTVIEVENNKFRGVVLTVETEQGEFFGVIDSFKPLKTA